jgi:hypothetical protein
MIFLHQKLSLALESSHISENSALATEQAISPRQHQSLQMRSQKAGCKAYATKSLVMTGQTRSLCQKVVEKAIAELTRNCFSFRVSVRKSLTVFA